MECLWSKFMVRRPARLFPQTLIHLGKCAVLRKGRQKWRKRKEEIFFPVPGSGFEPGTLTLEGKAPVCIATITLHKDPWLQLLYKYHEGYILNSIAQYPLHMKERQRKCHRAEFEGTENY